MTVRREEWKYETKSPKQNGGIRAEIPHSLIPIPEEKNWREKTRR